MSITTWRRRGSPVSLGHLSHGRDVEFLVRHESLQPGVLVLEVFNRWVSSAFIPPYWFRQRWKVCSETSRCLGTVATSSPSAWSRSASRSFRRSVRGCACVFHGVDLLESGDPNKRNHTRDGTVGGQVTSVRRRAPMVIGPIQTDSLGSDEMATPTLSLMQPSLDVGPSCLGDVDHDATRPCASSCASRHRFRADLGGLERKLARCRCEGQNDENPLTKRVLNHRDGGSRTPTTSRPTVFETATCAARGP